MKTSPFCQNCQLEKFAKKLKDKDVNKASMAFKEFEKTVRKYADRHCSPWIGARGYEILARYFGKEDYYKEEKEHFNRLILNIEERIEKEINSAEDPLKRALAYALIGNYIDFDAVKDVNEDKLFELLNEKRMSHVDEHTLILFRKDLEKGKKLVYLTDNCGEIVFDKLLIGRILKDYPYLDITVIVRGQPIINDATMDDAREVNLDKICRCIGNGTGYASTIYEELAPEAKTAVDEADLIIAKGQGNLEGFLGSNFNTYYLFLIKCDFFVNRFRKERFTPMFINEKEFPSEE